MLRRILNAAHRNFKLNIILLLEMKMALLELQTLFLFHFRLLNLVQETELADLAPLRQLILSHSFELAVGRLVFLVEN